MPNEFAEAPADKNGIQIRFRVVDAQGKNFILSNFAENVEILIEVCRNKWS